eukprot:14602275-Heterocapsa_arctica.AAC.1
MPAAATVRLRRGPGARRSCCGVELLRQGRLESGGAIGHGDEQLYDECDANDQENISDDSYESKLVVVVSR